MPNLRQLPAAARTRALRHVLSALLAAALLSPALAFDLQGHRGARGLLPENTLPAFERALREGVSTLELDVGMTRDGVLVVHHDLELNPNTTRDAQGQWLTAPGPAIHALSWDELQRFDVGRLKPGTRYAAPYPHQQPIDGTRVPRLADVFELVKRAGHEQARLAIELKLRPDAPDKTPAPEPFASALVQALRDAGLASRAQILSFDWRALQVVQRLAPEIPTVYLSAQQSWMDNIGAGRAEASPWTAGFSWREHGSVPRMVKAAGGAVWSVFHGDVDEARVREAHALGLKVLVWTVNDGDGIARVIDLGADGVVTDRPDVAQRVLRLRGIVPR